MFGREVSVFGGVERFCIEDVLVKIVGGGGGSYIGIWVLSFLGGGNSRCLVKVCVRLRKE